MTYDQECQARGIGGYRDPDISEQAKASALRIAAWSKRAKWEGACAIMFVLALVILGGIIAG